MSAWTMLRYSQNTTEKKITQYSTRVDSVSWRTRSSMSIDPARARMIGHELQTSEDSRRGSWTRCASRGVFRYIRIIQHKCTREHKKHRKTRKTRRKGNIV